MQYLYFALVVLSGFIAGVVNALAGGGTFLTFPALTGLAGLTEKAANMTSTIGVWPGSATSILAARSEFKLIPRSMLLLYGILSLFGGLTGSLLLVYTSSTTFTLVIPWLLAFATAVFACSKPIARWAGRKHGQKALKWTLLVGLIQFFISVYGGYFGAGMGVLMLAGLAFSGLDHIHQMNALKVLLGTIINGISIVVFVLYTMHARQPGDGVDWAYALPMAAAAAVGGFWGMRLARRVKPDNLRYIILGIGTLLTVTYFYKAYFTH